MSNPKPKKAAKRETHARIAKRALELEAAASVSLDGETKYCPACERDHICGRREITAEELAVVEAAVEWRKHYAHDGRHWHDGPLATVVDQYIGACRALRAARSKAR